MTFVRDPRPSEFGWFTPNFDTLLSSVTSGFGGSAIGSLGPMRFEGPAQVVAAQILEARERSRLGDAFDIIYPDGITAEVLAAASTDTGPLGAAFKALGATIINALGGGIDSGIPSPPQPEPVQEPIVEPSVEVQPESIVEPPPVQEPELPPVNEVEAPPVAEPPPVAASVIEPPITDDVNDPSGDDGSGIVIPLPIPDPGDIGTDPSPPTDPSVTDDTGEDSMAGIGDWFKDNIGDILGGAFGFLGDWMDKEAIQKSGNQAFLGQMLGLQEIQRQSDQNSIDVGPYVGAGYGALAEQVKQLGISPRLDTYNQHQIASKDPFTGEDVQRDRITNVEFMMGLAGVPQDQASGNGGSSVVIDNDTGPVIDDFNTEANEVNIPGFQHGGRVKAGYAAGGQFPVQASAQGRANASPLAAGPSAGPRDTELVQFMAAPGETVTVTPAGIVPPGRGGQPPGLLQAPGLLSGRGQGRGPGRIAPGVASTAGSSGVRSLGRKARRKKNHLRGYQLGGEFEVEPMSGLSVFEQNRAQQLSESAAERAAIAGNQGGVPQATPRPDQAPFQQPGTSHLTGEQGQGAGQAPTPIQQLNAQAGVPPPQSQRPIEGVYQSNADVLSATQPQTSLDKYGSFYESPGYNFVYDEAMRAVRRNAASGGRLYSGRTLRELQRYGSGLAATEYGNYYNRLADVSSQGLNAITGNAAQNTALANSRASSIGGAYNAQANATAARGGGALSSLADAAQGFLSDIGARKR